MILHSFTWRNQKEPCSFIFKCFWWVRSGGGWDQVVAALLRSWICVPKDSDFLMKCIEIKWIEKNWEKYSYYFLMAIAYSLFFLSVSLFLSLVFSLSVFLLHWESDRASQYYSNMWLPHVIMSQLLYFASTVISAEIVCFCSPWHCRAKLLVPSALTMSCCSRWMIHARFVLVGAPRRAVVKVADASYCMLVTRIVWGKSIISYRPLLTMYSPDSLASLPLFCYVLLLSSSLLLFSPSFLIVAPFGEEWKVCSPSLLVLLSSLVVFAFFCSFLL